ncbi:MAG: DUF1549 and DUF1553 domain-containing protein [Deltaproteobacteria bacterium]
MHCRSPRIWNLPVLIASLAAAVGPGSRIRAEEPATVADYDAIISKSDREHWAFQPVRAPGVPTVREKGWVRNPIDAFILARLEVKDWRPNEAAKPQALLRRMYLDLTGLPPTLQEQAALSKDPSAAAFDALIDELLARPAYGERWGRHWLDLVRYAESNGYERDGAKPSVWRYRDYVIRSFNADKPYDRFILEQLAGDELPDADAETVTALGYYRLGPWDDEPADPAEDRFDQLDDIVSTTSQVFLGLTLQCARCHNHKFEPLTTLDYYRMTAIVNPLQRFQSGRSDLDAPAGSPAELTALAERDKQIAALAAQISQLREEFKTDWLKSGKSRLPADAQAAFLAAPAGRTDEQKKLVEKRAKELEDEISPALPGGIKANIADIQEQIRRLREATPDLPRAYYLNEPSNAPPETHVLLRGKPSRPGIVAPPGVPAVLVSQQPELLPPDERTSRRRLSLARWLTDPKHPLTARVMVNRVWQFHFGEGLVRTPSDFGVMGDPATHPELLDYLAGEFIRHGWSLKWLHRLIMTSNTYRMSKEWNAEYGKTDPENRLLWRFPYRRLEVEAIRDSMLAVSGRLNPKMYGPAMFPFIPPEALAGNSDPDKIWPAYDEAEASRRTVYAFIKRSLVVPMIEVLDLCDTTKSSAKRAVTSVAPQALTLFNGRFVNEQAGHFARRLEKEAGDDPGRQIERAYQLALCRPPTAAEKKTMLEFLAAEAAGLAEESAGSAAPQEAATARHKALDQLCRVIFNLNEFVYSD